MDRIVGRETELEAIGRFLDAVPEAPAAFLVEGDPGIGKTTVWNEAVCAAESRAFRVLQARPAESEAELSYAALADLVGDVFDEARTTLAVVQERALGAALLREEPEGGANARTIATALVTVLTVLAARQSVLVAIDDVQWLDAASEAVLAFAARRLPTGVGVLVSRRPTDAGDLPLGLARALPERRLEHVVLGPLSLGTLHHLIVGRLGAPLPRPLLVRVADASGGNPFYALELARALARAPVEDGAAGPLPVPRNLEEVVAGRMAALSEAAHGRSGRGRALAPGYGHGRRRAGRGQTRRAAR